MLIIKIRQFLMQSGYWACALTLFAVPISKPLTNFALVWVALSALCGSRMQERFRLAFQHAVSRGAIIWMVVLLASAVHTWALTGAMPDMGSYVIALTYPLLFASLIDTAQKRDRVLMSFALAMALITATMYLQFMGLLPQRGERQAGAMAYTIFKEYTQQGLALLLAVSWLLAYANYAQKKIKILCYILAAAIFWAVVFLLQSRTTYVTLIPLSLFWLWQFVRAKTDIKPRNFVFSALAVFFGAALIWQSENVQTRLIASVRSEVVDYLQTRQATSSGVRMELWKQSIEIIADAPILGHGLKQWAPQFTLRTQDLSNYDSFKMGHPHQEGLLILSEQGLLGLAIWLLLLFALLGYIRKLPAPYRNFYASLLLVYVTAGLANCLWADFTHRHAFILLLACIPFISVARSEQRMVEASDD